MHRGHQEITYCLRSIRKASKLSLHTKLRIFKSNVLSVLLYGSECWKMTTTISQKLEVFQTKCLRRIRKIFWPNTINNEELLVSCGAKPITTMVKRRRLTWFGHTCRMTPEALPRTALSWTPQGKRRRGRPKETWRRTVQKELKEKNLTTDAARKKAQDSEQWRLLVDALCASRHEED